MDDALRTRVEHLKARMVANGNLTTFDAAVEMHVQNAQDCGEEGRKMRVGGCRDAVAMIVARHEVECARLIAEAVKTALESAAVKCDELAQCPTVSGVARQCAASIRILSEKASNEETT